MARNPPSDSIEPSTAPSVCIESRRFRVTHPFHPLLGREFDLIEIASTAGTCRVFYTDEDGTLRTIRQAFTNVALVDPFVRVAAGRSAFRVQDLLELATLLDSLDGDGRAAREDGGGAESVKGILRNV